MKPNDVEEGSGGGPASVPSSTAKYPKTTLQEQARELIDEILADTTAGAERNREQLEECVSRNPDRPEAALLEHLMNRTASSGE